MLYIGKGTLLKQGVPREKEKFSLFRFLNSSQNLLCFNGMLHLKYLLRHNYMNKELGIQKKKKINCPEGLLKPFTYFCLIIKMINVHSILEVAKSMKAKCLKYCIRNCWIVSNTFPASDHFSYLIFWSVWTAYWFYYIILIGALILNHPCILRLNTTFYRLFFE